MHIMEVCTEMSLRMQLRKYSRTESISGGYGKGNAADDDDDER